MNNVGENGHLNSSPNVCQESYFKALVLTSIRSQRNYFFIAFSVRIPLLQGTAQTHRLFFLLKQLFFLPKTLLCCSSCVVFFIDERTDEERRDDGTDHVDEGAPLSGPEIRVPGTAKIDERSRVSPAKFQANEMPSRWEWKPRTMAVFYRLGRD